jgi:hypothetical protein
MARDVWLDELTRALARATSRRAGVKGAVATVACCPQNTQCCGDGTCCDQGVPCCDEGDGPRCNPNCIS